MRLKSEHISPEDVIFLLDCSMHRLLAIKHTYGFVWYVLHTHPHKNILCAKLFNLRDVTCFSKGVICENSGSIQEFRFDIKFFIDVLLKFSAFTFRKIDPPARGLTLIKIDEGSGIILSNRI